MKKPFIPQITNVEILNYPVKAGSGNWGIAADVLGERKRHIISLTQEAAWIKASPEEKPLVAMEIAAASFRNDLMEHFNMDFRKIQSAQELMYHLWDSTGREAVGTPWDICINDKKYFPDNEETEIDFDIHDGFAVGEYEGKEYVMTYPTLLEVSLTKKLRQNISNYVGQAVTDTGITPADIALTYGEIKLVNDIPTYKKDIEADANTVEDRPEKAVEDLKKKQSISDIKIRKGIDGKMYISCQIFGEKQLAKRMTDQDVEYFQKRMASSDKAYNGVAPELAKKYYAKEIADTQLDRNQSQGVKI